LRRLLQVAHVEHEGLELQVVAAELPGGALLGAASHSSHQGQIVQRERNSLDPFHLFLAVDG
jgi:hypothetical protein